MAHGIGTHSPKQLRDAVRIADVCVDELCASVAQNIVEILQLKTRCVKIVQVVNRPDSVTFPL
jgi:hypothetical protein